MESGRNKTVHIQDDMIFVDNPNLPKATRTNKWVWWGQVNKINTEYTIWTMQKSVIFQYISKKIESWYQNNTTYNTIKKNPWNGDKINKICARPIHWKLQNIAEKHRMTYMNGEICHVHGPENSVLLICQFFPN